MNPASTPCVIHFNCSLRDKPMPLSLPIRCLLRVLRAACAVAALSLLAGAPAGAQPAAGTPAGASATTDPVAAYKEIDLKQLVASARTEIPGQRIIFAPSAVRFRAVLAALPAPQKTEYLQKALGMMGINSLGQVSQRIGLDYGGERALVAYIDDAAAGRLAREGKPGQPFEFYAYHVYNHSRGPALVVTSFSR